MSALGQKRTLRGVKPMSALPPITDIPESDWHVRFVPQADSCGAAIGSLLDHVVRNAEQRRRQCEPEHPSG
jgi:hypothetical protein